MSAWKMLATQGKTTMEVLRYAAFRFQDRSNSPEPVGDPAQRDQREELNPLLVGYPSNHNYHIRGNRLVPGFQLYERFRKVTSYYPETLESFLDIGCCRGFYVLDAALNRGCKTAVGVDVEPSFISISQKVKEDLGAAGAGFHLARLDDLVRDPVSYGGPFQTILLTGTYHYLYWGSSRSSQAFFSHRPILSRLHRLCTDRVLVSGRLEINQLPRGMREAARQELAGRRFTTSHFLEAASEFFHVQEVASLGTYPLFVLFRRQMPAHRQRPHDAAHGDPHRVIPALAAGADLGP